MHEDSINSFKDKLDKEYDWPALYTFKFIVPKGKENEIRELFSNHQRREKESNNGNYISITAEVMIQSSEKIVEYYIEADKVEGVIAL